MSLGTISSPRVVGPVTLVSMINASGGVSGVITIGDGGYGYVPGDVLVTNDFTDDTGVFPKDAELIVVSVTGPSGTAFEIVPLFGKEGTNGTEDITGTTEVISNITEINDIGSDYFKYNKSELGGAVTEYPHSNNAVNNSDRPNSNEYVISNADNIPSIKVVMGADNPQLKVQARTVNYGTGTITVFAEPTIRDYNGDIVGNTLRAEDILDRNRCTRNGFKWDFHDIIICNNCNETFGSSDLKQPGNRCPVCNAEYPEVLKCDVHMFCEYCNDFFLESELVDFHECPTCNKTWPYIKVIETVTYGAQLGQNVKATYGRCRDIYPWEVMPVTGLIDCPPGFEPYGPSGTCVRMIPGAIANETTPTTLAQARGAGYAWDYDGPYAIDMAAPSSLGYFAVGAIGGLFPGGVTGGHKFPMGEVEYVKTMCRQYGFVWNKTTNVCEESNAGNYTDGGTVNGVTFASVKEARNACVNDGYVWLAGACVNPNLFGDGQSRQGASADSLTFVIPK